MRMHAHVLQQDQGEDINKDIFYIIQNKPKNSANFWDFLENYDNSMWLSNHRLPFQCNLILLHGFGPFFILCI